MPHKKRTHSRQKKTEGETKAARDTPGARQTDRRPLTTATAAGSKAQSQPRQYSPTSVAQVAVNPTQFEVTSTTSKPGTTSVTMSGAKGSGAKVEGSATTTSKPGTTSVTMSGAKGSGAKVEGSATTAGTTTAPFLETGPSIPAKSTSAHGEGNIVTPKVKESPKQPAKGVSTTPSNADMAKKDTAKVPTTLAASAHPTAVAPQKGRETKVQVEVAPSATKAAKEEHADPIDALAGLLPDTQPLPAGPVYTGPVVTEHVVTSTEAVICGGRDVPLPPGYRFEETHPVENPKDVKSKDVQKPMSTNDALDSLSLGFETPSAPAPQKQEKKMEQFASAPMTKSAAPPADKKAVGKKTEQSVSTPMTRSSAPPADKKAKVEKGSEDFSLMSGLESPLQTKPKTDKGVDMSLDALNALGDTLGAPKAHPEPPKIRPEDIIQEKPLSKTKGVLVGEREDSIPEAYRFKEDKNKNLPPPKIEPSMDSGEALDILSGDFMTPSVSHGVQAPVLCPPAPLTQATEKVSSHRSEDVVASTKASSVQAPMPPPQTNPPQIAVCRLPAPEKGRVWVQPPAPVLVDQDMSLDALDALGDTLGAPKAQPEPTKIRPEDIIQENPLSKTKGVLVGEREDSIPEAYRFKEDKNKNLPPPKKEPSMDSGEALDILSGDFMTPSVSHGVQAPVLCPPAPPTQKAEQCASAPTTWSSVPTADKLKAVKGSEDFSLMSGLQSPLQTKPTTYEGVDMSLDALDALGDTLGAPKAHPEPPKIRPEDIIQENPLSKTKGVLVGEREDSIPEAYRFKEDKNKNLPPPKKEPAMDSGEALDILSGDFMTPSVSHGVQAPVLCTPAPPTQATKKVSSHRAEDVVASTKASSVQAPMPPPQTHPPQTSTGTVDALNMLSDTLMDISPAPEPTVPIAAKDIVKEKKIKEEKVIKMGERDDTLPPGYRPSKEDHKPTADAKAHHDVKPKQPSMDDTTALDLLSGDFSMPAAQDTACAAKTTKQTPPSQEPMAGPVLDDLADTLVPGSIKSSQGDKPKSKSKSKTKSKKQREDDPAAIDHLSSQLGSDVVPASTNKGSKS
ncbi:hypothetical protein UPYG_G00161220 [Umbra pygmaea]|uniref:Calpastatin n=1 Tax=Umbra pygmaea TaxID=75934 RepID=A0ABD0X3P8_UMBPY